MEKCNIMLIILAIFSITLLLNFENIKIAYAETKIYNVTATNANATISGNSGLQRFAGEGMVAGSASALVAQSAQRMTIDLRCFDSALADCSGMSGDVLIGVWSLASAPTSTNYLALFNTIPANTLTETYQSFTFSFTSYKFTGNTAFGVFHNVDYGTVNKRIEIKYFLGTNQFNGGNTKFAFYSTLWNTDATSDLTATLINVFSSPFCQIPANANLLTCRLQADGNTGLSGTSQLLNQSATNLTCQVGVLSCTQDSSGNFIPNNPDVKTNGVGYLLVAVSMGVFVGLLFIASRGQITEIPTFVWFVGTIAIIGALTAIEYIDPTFLIITIITVIAFAVAKAKGVFAGAGGLFKGETV